MNEHPEPLGNDDAMDQEIGKLPDAAADDAFRSRLKSAFMRGDFAEQSDAKPSQRKIPPTPLWRWVAMPLAACLVLIAVFLMNRGPDLTLAGASWDGVVIVDGDSIPVVERARLTRALTAGSRVEVPAGAGLDVSMGNVMLFEIAGGTEMILPESPGRWFGRAVECSVLVGELRIMTGSAFHRSTFTAYTPDGMIRITGTMISIQCDAGGTCVCVLEGLAHVGTDEADLEPVEPGYRKVMLKDGTVEILPIKPMHRDGVLEFESRMHDAIQR